MNKLIYSIILQHKWLIAIGRFPDKEETVDKPTGSRAQKENRKSHGVERRIVCSRDLDHDTHSLPCSSIYMMIDDIMEKEKTT